MGLVGFTKTLALEGAKYNIKANAIAPVSSRRVSMSIPLIWCSDRCLCHDGHYYAARDVEALRRMCSLSNFHLCLPQRYLQPEYVAPLVAAITHPDGPDASGKVFVLGAGYISEIRWERSGGVVFKTDNSFTPSAVSVPLLSFSYPLDACTLG